MQSPGNVRALFGAGALREANYYVDLVLRYLLPGTLRHLGYPKLDPNEFRDFVDSEIRRFVDAYAEQGLVPSPNDMWRWIHGPIMAQIPDLVESVTANRGPIYQQWASLEEAPTPVHAMLPPSKIKQQVTTVGVKDGGSAKFSAGRPGGVTEGAAAIQLRRNRRDLWER